MIVDIDGREQDKIVEDDLLKNYKFLIIETLQREVDIKAASEDDAFDKISHMYRNAEIVLDADDFSDYEINLVDNPDDEEEE